MEQETILKTTCRMCGKEVPQDDVCGLGLCIRCDQLYFDAMMEGAENDK